MPRKYNRKTNKGAGGRYTAEQLKQAKDEVLSCRMSLKKAAKFYNIPRTTLMDQTKKQRTFRESPAVTLGRAPDLPPDVEQSMANSLKVMEKWGMGLTKQQFLDEVQKHVSMNKISTRFTNNRPGEDWWFGFKKRNNISLKKPERLENLRAVQQADPFIILGFYDLLQKTAEELDILDKPECWFNLDETSFCRDPGSLKIAGAKGSPATRRTGGNGRDNTTVLACVNASGEKLPPLVVFSGKNTWSSWLPVQDHPDACFSATKKGWMTADLFYNWFRDVFLPQVKEKALLILDGHGSHLSLALAKLASEKNVTILKLPAHASHVLQPLDRVIFKGLKSSYEQKLVNWQRAHPGDVLSRPGLVKILCQIWETYLTPSLIQKSFQATGIYDSAIPARINRDVVDNAKFDPAKFKRYVESKKSETQNLTRVTTRVNTATEQITISVLVSPKKNHTHEKSFEELLLDSVRRPSLDASASGTSGRQRVAREAEVITSAEALRVLEQREKEKKEKLENKKGKVKKNTLKPKLKKKKKDDLSSEDSDVDVSSGSSTDEMDIRDTVGSEHEEEEEKKLNIQLNEYYAVAYDTKRDQQGWYIGRVLDFPDENLVRIKYLRCLSLADYSYDWPKKDDIDEVEENYIFAGPLRLSGAGPFTLPPFQIRHIISLYKKHISACK
jgi:hypothetical protein